MTCTYRLEGGEKVPFRVKVGSRGAKTKGEIARAVAAEFPELAPHLPPPRKPWMSEDQRMGIFGAMALALTEVERRAAQ